MRGSKFKKGIAAALIMTLAVSMAVPGLATETADTQSEEVQILPEGETGTEFEAGTDSSADVVDLTNDESESAVEVGTDLYEEGSDVLTEQGGEDETDADEADESEPVVLSADENENELSVSISPESVSFNNVGATQQLVAKLDPEDAEYDDMEWSSSNEDIATVDDNGKVTSGSTVGTATITVTVTYSVDTEGGETKSQTCDASCDVTLTYTGLYKGTDNNWYYYSNGQVDTSKTAVVSGTVNGTKGEWNIVNGKLKTAADVVKYNGDWWYFNANGMLDTGYTGFASNSNGSWYMENGKLERDENGVIKDKNGAIGSNSEWYYVLNSKVQTSFTGLADYKNDSGWWYITKGKVDRTVTTVAKNKNGWYYVKNGKVDRSYTGFATNSSGNWYVKAGKVSKTVNGVYKDSSGALGSKSDWYYVLNSKVQTSFTGLANYSNASGWWYITKGKVDRTYKGLAKNKNGWYYLTKGKVDRSYTGFSKNSNGDWYVEKGKVTKSAKGVVKDTTGVLGTKGAWYYISGSKVQYNFTGIASNSNGYWYIKNGKLDRTFNGSITYNGVTYQVKNGKADTNYTAIGMSQTMYNNAQSQSSSTKWLIMVDVTNCKFGIFQGSKGNWVPYKCWDCTTGASGSPTCIGAYSIYGKGTSFGDSDHTCYWYSQFNGNYLIHSILYYPGTHTVKEGRLGMHLSNGCIRLSYDNAYWVYCNVPYGTRVRTYK